MAVAMNTSVAVIERGESRAMPHTPWPDVQPPPSRVPKPTRSPAAMAIAKLGGIHGIGTGCPTAPSSSGAATRPIRNATRQPRSSPVSASPRMAIVGPVAPQSDLYTSHVMTGKARFVFF